MRFLKYVVSQFQRVSRKLRHDKSDYRDYLFEELKEYLPDGDMGNVLEIGPRDGEDTIRLLELAPKYLALLDLPDKEERVASWYEELKGPNVQLHFGNFMYEDSWSEGRKFSLIWCTGVLYHNPEQLRMIAKLYDILEPEGVLVIESATARRRGLRHDNCVEIWHDIDKSVHRKHHVSRNVTHLPSKKAMNSWLDMVGFENIHVSDCHARQSLILAEDRAAFIARRPKVDSQKGYYSIVDLNYQIGRST